MSRGAERGPMWPFVVANFVGGVKPSQRVNDITDSKSGHIVIVKFDLPWTLGNWHS